MADYEWFCDEVEQLAERLGCSIGGLGITFGCFLGNISSSIVFSERAHKRYS